MRGKEAQELAQYVAVMSVTEQQQARRVGLTLGSLRVLVRVKVLTDCGLRLRVADLITSHTAAAGETRQNVKRLLASGHLEREGGPVAGRLLISESGRMVVAEMMRGLERARVALVCFEPCGPFRRVVPRKKITTK
jgi:hypothetical protein